MIFYGFMFDIGFKIVFFCGWIGFDYMLSYKSILVFLRELKMFYEKFDWCYVIKVMDLIKIVLVDKIEWIIDVVCKVLMLLGL